MVSNALAFTIFFKCHLIFFELGTKNMAFVNRNASGCSQTETNFSMKTKKEFARLGSLSNYFQIPKKPRESCDFIEQLVGGNITEFQNNVKFQQITAENLNLKYARLFSRSLSDMIIERLENEITYFSGDLLKVKVYGKWHNIPRKQKFEGEVILASTPTGVEVDSGVHPPEDQSKSLESTIEVAFGDSGLSYAFSGNKFPAESWNPLILALKEVVEKATGQDYNFVLINRYKDGDDHIGEHRDDEKDLVQDAPIASLSFGQPRKFVFKHKDSRGVKAVRKINPVEIVLDHGSLLLMESPTNSFWYHSLPKSKMAKNVRVNLTFRKLVCS